MELCVTDEPASAGKTGRSSHWRPRLRRILRRMLIGNLLLATGILTAAVVAHAWATSTEERFEKAIEVASYYLLVPVGLITEHSVPPAAIRPTAQLMERLVIDSVGIAPRSDRHLYWQGRMLMAMPEVYKHLNLPSERLSRGERGITIFTDLAARNAENLDYRRRLAVTMNLHGEALAELGHHEQAIEQWRRSLSVAEQLLERQPGHWRWHSYVATAELGIGKSFVQLGQSAAGTPHLTVARSIARRLCAAAPSDARLCALAERADQAYATNGHPTL